MKKWQRIVVFLLTLSMLISAVPVFAAAEEERCVLYVATDGNDGNDGSITRPLATLQGARDKIRSLKQSGNYEKGFVVYVRDGRYNMSESLKLDERDSGTEAAPITYRAYGDEKVTLTGGVSVSGSDFTKVTDAAILDRIVESSARDKIYSLDLKKYGVTKVDDPYRLGAYGYEETLVKAGLITGRPNVNSIEVLFNGKAMSISRYPNSGYMYVKNVTQKGYDIDAPGAAPLGTPFIITVDDDRMKHWTQADPNKVMLYGFWHWEWADQAIPAAKFNPDNNEITSLYHSRYGVWPDKPFYVYNLLEEVDAPGEYYIDQESCTLYLYPEGPMASADITITLLADDLISFKNVENVSFKGFDIVGARGAAINIQDGKNNSIVDCDISYTAKHAVWISGYNNGVRDSYIHDVEGGVQLGGGDYETLTPGNCYVTNCEIARFSRLSAAYIPAVAITGVGNIISFCEMYDSPHQAISYDGNLNKIMYNDIHDVLKETDDAGVIYGGLTWVARGNEVKYNYIHDVDSATKTDSGSGKMAIYMDGGGCGLISVGNVIENFEGTGFMFGGRDNIMLNNVLINVGYGVAAVYPMNKGTESFTKHHYPRLNAAPWVTNEVWQETFPELQNLLAMDDNKKGIPEDNVFQNNILYNTTMWWDQSQVKDTYMDVTQNINTQENPGFYDLANGNYNLDPSEELLKKLPGFKGIPFTRMGRSSERAVERVKNAVVMAIDSSDSYVDGKLIRIDENPEVVPYIKNSKTFIPLRFLAEALGASVEFEEGIVKISSHNVNLELKPGSTEAKKNGEAITLETAAEIVENRTMVPLREVSELLDKSVFWEKRGFISISDDDALFDVDDVTDVELISYLYERMNQY